MNTRCRDDREFLQQGSGLMGRRRSNLLPPSRDGRGRGDDPQWNLMGRPSTCLVDRRIAGDLRRAGILLIETCLFDLLITDKRYFDMIFTWETVPTRGRHWLFHCFFTGILIALSSLHVVAAVDSKLGRNRPYASQANCSLLPTFLAGHSRGFLLCESSLGTVVNPVGLRRSPSYRM